MVRKYVSLQKLSCFLDKIKQNYALKIHSHTKSDIIDFPIIPTKLSDLTDDIGLYTNIVKGTIVIWSGTIEDIPNGWQLCDGTNGTPDLRGKFVLGAGGDYGVGNAGGEVEHALTIDEMPEHEHGTGIDNQNGITANTGSMSAIVYYDNTRGSLTTSTGGNQPHNNMPPYYALCYIMKITDNQISEDSMNTIVSEVLESLPTWEGGSY